MMFSWTQSSNRFAAIRILPPVKSLQGCGRNRQRTWFRVLAFFVASFFAHGLLAVCATITASPAQEAAATAPSLEKDRAAYLVDVPLPIVGNTDEQVERQIGQIISQSRGDEQRPIVVLRFAVGEKKSEAGDGGGERGTRGTRFERALSLARYLTSPAAAKVRLIAYVAETVEGHAVLPVLACEEIIATEQAELGRAAIDESTVDATITSAYRDIARRRGTLSDAAVQAMLDSNIEVVRVELTDGSSTIVTAQEAKALREEGKDLGQNNIWSGGSYAAFSGRRMRELRWVAKLVNSSEQLPEALGITGRLHSVRLLPDEWRAATLEISEKLDDTRVNQIIRAIQERKQRDKINLVVLKLSDTQASLETSLRLANFIAELDTEGVSSASIIEQASDSPAILIALACDQVIALDGVVFGPDPLKPAAKRPLSSNEAAQRSLMEIDRLTARPASLMAAAIDRSSVPKIYVDQKSGKRLPLVEWQVTGMVNSADWLPNESLIEAGIITREAALRYGLVDRFVADRAEALRSIGLSEEPPVVDGPWLEGAIRQLLARDWIAKLLMAIGFAALFIEFGSPGLGAGAFVAAICFVGFFWIEMLNGNVEWLEVILFVGGLVSLAVELFVLPGFGLFGIGGLLMVFTSVVLASQTFVFPSNSEQLNVVANNLFWVAVSALAVMVGMVFMRKQLENTPMFRWMTLEPAGTSDLEDLDHREAIVHWEHLLGQDGLTTTRLNPAGKAQFGRQIVNVLGTHMVGEGAPVRVVEVRGNSIFVEPFE